MTKQENNFFFNQVIISFDRVTPIIEEKTTATVLEESWEDMLRFLNFHKWTTGCVSQSITAKLEETGLSGELIKCLFENEDFALFIRWLNKSSKSQYRSYFKWDKLACGKYQLSTLIETDAQLIKGPNTLSYGKSPFNELTETEKDAVFNLSVDGRKMTKQENAFNKETIYINLNDDTDDDSFTVDTSSSYHISYDQGVRLIAKGQYLNWNPDFSLDTLQSVFDEGVLKRSLAHGTLLIDKLINKENLKSFFKFIVKSPYNVYFCWEYVTDKKFVLNILYGAVIDLEAFNNFRKERGLV